MNFQGNSGGEEDATVAHPVYSMGEANESMYATNENGQHNVYSLGQDHDNSEAATYVAVRLVDEGNDSFNGRSSFG